MMHGMRTTITLEPDVEALVRRAMRSRQASLKTVVNDALRAGLAAPGDGRGAFRQRTHDMGEPAVDLTSALRLAAEMEDEELARRLAVGT